MTIKKHLCALFFFIDEGGPVLLAFCCCLRSLTSLAIKAGCSPEYEDNTYGIPGAPGQYATVAVFKINGMKKVKGGIIVLLPII